MKHVECASSYINQKNAWQKDNNKKNIRISVAAKTQIYKHFINNKLCKLVNSHAIQTFSQLDGMK